MDLLSLALVSHAFSGLLIWQVAVSAAIALPGTVGGAWLYRLLADHGYQRVVLLLVSGIGLIWTTW
jgi:hypothetical protein